ncbi:MAG: hypothetical protein LBK61_04965, partial [Spirochaetaceae bacterium]|nr:hypothetical protein [Spirochaetaceae bacterium]
QVLSEVLPEAKLHAAIGRGALRGFASVEGVAEDQAEGDVDAPQVRTYRPERSVRSEGETSPFL